MTRRGVFTLLNLIIDLNYIYERCRSASIITTNQRVQVKGETYLLDCLKRQYPVLKTLSATYETLKGIDDLAREWIAYLDKKYVEQIQFFGPSIYIDFGDAKRLLQDVQTWTNQIIGEYAKQVTIYIKSEEMSEVFPADMLSRAHGVSPRAETKILHLMPLPKFSQYL